jgi:uncharacterized membrane protein YphA (DoxX/SURF4 family)
MYKEIIRMKIVVLIARILLGLMFVVFGSNGFLHFIPMKDKPTEQAAKYMAPLMEFHLFYFIAGIMVLTGLLFLINRFVPLALVLLGPVLVNILLFHLLVSPAGFQPGVVATILWFVLFYAHRNAFAGVFQAKA